jgi:hypothetical protein
MKEMPQFQRVERLPVPMRLAKESICPSCTPLIYRLIQWGEGSRLAVIFPTLMMHDPLSILHSMVLLKILPTSAAEASCGATCRSKKKNSISVYAMFRISA